MKASRRLVPVLGALLVLAACTSGFTDPTTVTTTLTPDTTSPPPATTPATPRTEALTGATNADEIAPCDPDVRPQPAVSSPVTPPVPGSVDLRVVGQLGGQVQAARLAGDDLFVGSGQQVVHVGLSEGRDPRELSVSPPVAGAVEDVTLVGELLLAALGDGGLAVLDPEAELGVVSSLALPGYAHAVLVEGSNAFVADGPGGLRVVDLRDPAAPVEIATLLDLHRIVDVAVDGNRAYLAAADEGLVVVDIANPAGPRELGRLFTGGYAFAVAIAGDRILLADGWAGLQVIDVANPRTPRLVATVATTGWAMDVSTEGGRAYLASGDEFVVLEIADPDRPVEIGHLPFHPAHAVRVDADAGRAVVVDDTTGVRIVEVAGAAPLELSIYAPLAPANGLALVGDRVFVAAGRQGLRTVDVSDPESPRELSGIATQDAVHGVAAVGSNVFFTTWPDRWVPSIFGLDASAPDPNPERPFAAPLMLATASVGTAMFVAAELGVVVLEVSHRSPCRLAFLETQVFAGEGFEANGITVAGDFAYVAPYFEEVRVVDISDPRAPVLLPQTGDSGAVGVGKTLAVGAYLYAIGDDGEGPVVAVYDLAVPVSPVLVGKVRLPAETARADEAGPPMAYGEGRLFVADGSAGLVVIDVSDPTTPVIAGRLRLPGYAVGVIVDGGHAYVASHGGGLFVVDWSEREASSDLGVLFQTEAPRPSDPAGQIVPASLRLPAASSIARSATTDCLVTSVQDSGPGSLRQCLAQTGSGVISFDPVVFPPDDPATIHIEGARLTVLPGVTVDGSEAGVIIDGGQQVDTGLYVDSRTVIRGLIVTGFTSYGIHVDGSGNTIADNTVSGNGDTGIVLFGPDNRVVGNLIGLDPSGNRLWGSQKIGVFVSEAGNVVGGPNATDRNVISGHGTQIYLKGGTETTIQGNYVGTDRLGQVVLYFPEELRGIYIDSGATNNRVVGNVVAGNLHVIDPGTSYNTIVGNLFGVDASGTRPLELGGGPVIDEPFNRVGGTLPGEANIINGGIAIQASDVIVLGNHMGVDASGNPIGAGGVQVANRRAVVGGRSPTAANVISGDLSGAIRIHGDANLIIGNRIRIPGVPTPDQQESDNGILLENYTRNHIIANLVETDAGVGIRLSGDAYANIIRGNLLRNNAVGLITDPSSADNLVSLNTFDANTTQALDQGVNRWDDGRLGNYWSDLEGSDADGDGVLDQPRQVPPQGLDRYPLARSPS